jgi:putative cell wall-binding protein
MRKPIQPIRKKASVLRDERNARIKDMYSTLMAIEGSQRTAVCEHIAEVLKSDYPVMSYSTVIKVTK